MVRGTTVHAVIDRFEGDEAVLEVDGRERRVPRASIDPVAREGDVITLADERVDRAETERRRGELDALRDRTPRPGGDFEL